MRMMRAVLGLRRDEQGVTAVIAGVSLVALMAAIMLSLDAGNLWQTRRMIVTATDATALHAARAAALNGAATACSGYQGRLQANAGSDAQAIDCRVVSGPLGNSGYVVVEARKPSKVLFGGLLGVADDKSAYSMSAAKWGHLTQVQSVRPIGICLQNSHVQAYVTDTPELLGIHPSPGVHRIMFTKDNPAACGGAAGNWGWLDFNGGSNSTSEMNSWLLNGYPGTVGIGDCNGDGIPGDMCSGDTGSGGGAVNNSLQALVDSREIFGVVIFDAAMNPGANAVFNVWGILGVRLVGFRMTGAESSRYFDMEFHRITMSGNCCLPAGSFKVFGTELCAVDHDPLPEAVRCTG